MIRFLLDESVNYDALRALRTARPDLDILSIQEAGRRGDSDDQVIDLSIQSQRVIVTSDRRTPLGLAKARIRHGATLPGVVVTNPNMSPGASAADLALIADALRPDELSDQFLFLPL